MKNFFIIFACLLFITSCTEEEFEEVGDTIEQSDLRTVVIQVYIEYTERDTADVQYGLSGLFPFEVYGSTNMVSGYIYDDVVGQPIVHSMSKTYHVHKDSLYIISDNLNFSDFTTYTTISDSAFFSVNISVYNGIQNSLIVSIPNQIEHYTLFAPKFALYDDEGGIESQTFDVLNTITPTSSKTFRIYTGNSPDNLVQTGSDLPINELNLGIANGYITANYTSSQPYNYQNQISFDYTE